MNPRESALIVCVGRSESMAVRHLASRASVGMRAAAWRGIAARNVGACVHSGQRAVSALLGQSCSSNGEWAGLDARCLREAVGSVSVHRIRPADIHAWDEFAKLKNLASLVVTGAVNVDTWRRMTVGHERSSKMRYIYVTILATTEEWASR